MNEILKKVKDIISFVSTDNMSQRKLDLVKTNFLFSKIRDKVNSKCEIYYKWHLLNAFNGTSYTCSNNSANSVIQIMCFHSGKVHKNLLSEKIYNYLSIEVVILGEEKFLIGIEDLLKIWEEQFNKIWNEQGDRLLFQVKRIQLWLIYFDPDNSSTSGQEFVKTIASSFNNNVLSTNISLPIYLPFDKPEWHLDAEIIFNETLEEEQVLHLLNKLVPIQASFFDFGYTFNNNNQTNFNENLQYIQFFLRHF